MALCFENLTDDRMVGGYLEPVKCPEATHNLLPLQGQRGSLPHG